jgi:hypothetical protein
MESAKQGSLNRVSTSSASGRGAGIPVGFLVSLDAGQASSPWDDLFVCWKLNDCDPA